MTKNPANRGLFFEQLIIQALEIERHRKRAIIIKVPTPWKVQRAFNPYSKKSEIVKAFPEGKSTVDFLGLYMGRALAFEAKSTENKRSFPIANIEQHQLDFLEEWEEVGGFSFVLVHFTKYDKTFFITWKQLKEVIAINHKKSIPLQYFIDYTHEIQNMLRFLDELKKHHLV